MESLHSVVMLDAVWDELSSTCDKEGLSRVVRMVEGAVTDSGQALFLQSGHEAACDRSIGTRDCSRIRDIRAL
jgi:hypothetical protein